MSANECMSINVKNENDHWREYFCWDLNIKRRESKVTTNMCKCLCESECKCECMCMNVKNESGRVAVGMLVFGSEQKRGGICVGVFE